MSGALSGTRKQGVLLAGFGLLALCVAWLVDRSAAREWLQGYLVAWLFCLAIPLGCLTLSCIHTLTGGRWGRVMFPLWRAGAALLPLVGVLWLPLLLGASQLLPWAADSHEPSSPRWFLNMPFLWIRSVLLFVLWLGIAWRQRRWAGLLELPRKPLREQGFAGASLLVLLLTISLLGVDWVMALVPSWRSTALGMLLMTSFITVAFALSILLRAGDEALLKAGGGNDDAALQLRRDFGNLLLACVLGWAYLAFMDYLTAWIADLPAETVWYLPRMAWPWVVLPVALLILHLAVPMALLLPRRGKQSVPVLRATAAIVLVMQFVNMLWLVLPGLRPRGRSLTWTDLLLWIGVAACMLAGVRIPGPAQLRNARREGPE